MLPSVIWKTQRLRQDVKINQRIVGTKSALEDITERKQWGCIIILVFLLLFPTCSASFACGCSCSFLSLYLVLCSMSSLKNSKVSLCRTLALNIFFLSLSPTLSSSLLRFITASSSYFYVTSRYEKSEHVQSRTTNCCSFAVSCRGYSSLARALRPCGDQAGSLPTPPPRHLCGSGLPVGLDIQSQSLRSMLEPERRASPRERGSRARHLGTGAARQHLGQAKFPHTQGSTARAGTMYATCGPSTPPSSFKPPFKPLLLSLRSKPHSKPPLH